jgi:small conductance mechanosensitive channel
MEINILDWFLSSGIKIIIIALVAYIAIRISNKFIKKWIRKMVERGYDIRDGEAISKRVKTLSSVINGAIKIVVIGIAVFMILSEMGIDIGPLLAGAGIVGVALGFGAQSIVKDFLSGLFIIFEDQYRVGDVVCLDETCGGVENITLRKTVLRDLDGKIYHIPNGEVRKVANMTKGYSRSHMNISVAYKEDIDKVMALINKVGKEMAEVSPWKEYIRKPIQVLGPGPDNFGESGIEIKVLGETKPLKQWDTLKEFRRRLKKAFDEEGIEFPFPQMSIWPRGKWEK